MRKVLSFCCIASSLVAIASCSRGYQVTGHLDGLDADSVRVMIFDKNQSSLERTETIAAPGGYIAFNLNLDYPTSVIVTGMTDEALAGGRYVSFPIIPGEEIELSGTLADQKITGTGFYKDMEKFSSVTKTWEEEFNAFAKDMSKQRREHPELADSLNQVYTAKVEEYSSKMMDAYMDYIKDNPSSKYSAYLASQLPEDKFLEAQDILSKKVKEGVMSHYLTLAKKAFDAERVKAEAKERIREGNPAPDFTLPTPDGSSLSLSTLKGKYILLDFWGSWCHWCIEGIPDLQKFYSNRADKIEFLSIACSDSEAKWKAALEKYDMPWKHVLNDGDVDVSSLYAIEGYPTFVIINPKGNIEKIFLGESDEFISFMDDLLN